MALVTLNDANLTAIADAIRAKGVEGNFTPSQMAPAIASIETGGGGSSSGSCMYESAEAMYQDIRPKSWPELPDAKTFMSDLLDYEYPKGQVVTALLSIPESAISSSIQFAYINSYNTFNYRFYKVVNKELILIDERLDQYHKSFSFNFSSYKDEVDVDEYGGYLFVISMHTNTSVPIFSRRDSTTAQWPYAIDVDWYVHSQSWGGNADNNKYATYELYKAFPNCEYLRLQSLVPGYYSSATSSSQLHIGLSSGSFTTSSSIIKVLRRCDFVQYNSVTMPAARAIGDVYAVSDSYLDYNIYDINKFNPTVIHQGVGPGITSAMTLPYGRNTGPNYGSTPKIIFYPNQDISSSQTAFNLYLSYDVDIEIRGQVKNAGNSITITRYNGVGVTAPGYLYKVVMAIYNALSNANTMTGAKSITRLRQGDLTQEEITNLQALGFTLSFS